MNSWKIDMPYAFGDAFLEFHDLGPRGYSLIPGAAAMTGRVVIWTPSAVVIDTENKAKRLNFNSSDLVRWIKDGLVQVAARYEWLHSENSRKKGYWQSCPWTPGFDDELRRLARDDEAVTDIRQRRVIGLDVGKGYQAARRTLNAHNDTVERVTAYLENNAIPNGIVQAGRLNYRTYDPDREFSLDEFIKYYVLAWVYNYVEAQAQLDANIAVSSERQALIFQDIIRENNTAMAVPDALPKFNSINDLFASDYISEILDFMHFLMSTRETSGNSLLQFTSKPVRLKFLRDIQLNLNTPPLFRFEAELAETVSDLSWQSYKLPSNPGSRERNVLKMIEELWNALSLIQGNVSPGILRTKALETLNVKGIKKFKNHWAFLIAGKRSPRKRDLEKMLSWLERFRERRKYIL